MLSILTQTVLQLFHNTLFLSSSSSSSSGMSSSVASSDISSPSSCPICDEKYNKTTRKITNCNACEHHACSSCVEQYFKSSNVHPQCMACHKPWNHQSLREKLGAASIKRITATHKELLFQEQNAMAPHTQEFIRLQKQKESIKTLQDETSQKIDELKALQRDLNRQDIQTDRDIRSYIHVLSGNVAQDQERGQSISLNVYIRQCGEDECKGYINKATGQCDLCEVKYCLHCMEKKTDDHECKDEDIQTIRLLSKDSKNCPKCTTIIHRISGCPDMFCVHCKTAFNWNTLKINRNGNSNPHYYQWLNNVNSNTANNPNGPEGLNPCDVNVGHVTRNHKFRKLSHSTQEDLLGCIRSMDHTIRNIDSWKRSIGKLPAMYEYFYSTEDDNLPPSFAAKTLVLRSRFLKNEIDETTFKTGIMRIHKADEFNTHLDDIKNALDSYRTEFMVRIVFSEEPQIDFKKLYEEYVRFAVYMNTCVDNLTAIYYGAPAKECTCIASLQYVPINAHRTPHYSLQYRGFLDVPDNVRFHLLNYIQLVKEGSTRAPSAITTAA